MQTNSITLRQLCADLMPYFCRPRVLCDHGHFTQKGVDQMQHQVKWPWPCNRQRLEIAHLKKLQQSMPFNASGMQVNAELRAIILHYNKISNLK